MIILLGATESYENHAPEKQLNLDFSVRLILLDTRGFLERNTNRKIVPSSAYKVKNMETLFSKHYI